MKRMKKKLRDAPERKMKKGRRGKLIGLGTSVASSECVHV